MRFFSKNKYLRLGLSILVLILFCYYFIGNKDKFQPLLNINPLLLVMISLIYALSVASNGIFTKLIIKPFNVTISLTEGVFLAIISSVGNFFAPAGAGYGLRAVYLKRRHGLSYTNYSATLAGYYILSIMIYAILGLVAVLLLRSNEGPNYIIIALGLTGALLFSLFFSLVRIPSNKAGGDKGGVAHKVLHFAAMITKGWHEIYMDHNLLMQLVALTLGSLALNMIMIGAIVFALHLSTSFAAILLYSVLGFLSIFFNVTPGNIGIKEGVILFSASVLGFSLSQVILIAVVERGMVFLSLLYLWGISEGIKRKLFGAQPS